MKRLFRTVLGVLLGIFARAYLSTLRATVHVDPALEATDPRPWVLCFWHGDQFALLRWKRRRPTVALVSLSADGQMQAQALALQGLRVERGSTSRRAALGLLGLVRRLSRGEDVALAVDGPRGPRFSVAPGAIAAARLSRGLLVPMASVAPRGVTLRKTWDQFRIPLPFSRIYVTLGAPIVPTADRPTPEELAHAISEASRLAREAARVVASDPHAVLRHAGRA